MRVIALLSLLPLFAALCTTPSHAESLGVGFPAVSANVNLLDSAELLPKFVRAAICAPLISASTEDSSEAGPGRYSLVSDSYTVSTDYDRWSFRIRSTARFSDGSLVRPEDVTYSLNRCAARGALSGMVGVRGFSEAEVPWIELTARPQGVEAATRLRGEIAGCPIVQRTTALRFGDSLGEGSNLVCGGGYALGSFSAGNRYLLARMRRSLNDRSGPDELEVRGFKGLEPGLSALRVGTIGAFVSPDPAVPGLVGADETLELKQCPNYWLIRRRDVVIDCFEQHLVLGLQGGR